jgi:glycosyltransferase involved in cell wall biosynthesis
MKVIHLSTNDRTGGAALAAWRLSEALCDLEIDSRMLVRSQTYQHPMALPAIKSPWGRLKAKGLELLELSEIIPLVNGRAHWFHYSTGSQGLELATLKEVRDAEVLHLHWVNKSFLSIGGLKKLFQLGKPIVWTVHDMSAFTGGCHYSGTCDRYQTQCHTCPKLRNASPEDRSAQVWAAKSEVFKLPVGLNFVSPSRWMGEVVSSSSLVGHLPVHNLPNPIDTRFFAPGDKTAMRTKLKLPLDKPLILYMAMNISDERKGFRYLRDSLNRLYGASGSFQPEVVVMGKADRQAFEGMPMRVHYLGYTSSEALIHEALVACDVLAMPSLADNFPNTILEAMACGTPVVAFNTGGIPEMVKHRGTGFLAPLYDSQSFADGLRWVLEDEERRTYLSKASRKQAENEFSYQVVGKRFEAFYDRLLSQPVYRNESTVIASPSSNLNKGL